MLQLVLCSARADLHTYDRTSRAEQSRLVRIEVRSLLEQNTTLFTMLKSQEQCFDHSNNTKTDE